MRMTQRSDMLWEKGLEGMRLFVWARVRAEEIILERDDVQSVVSLTS